MHSCRLCMHFGRLRLLPFHSNRPSSCDKYTRRALEASTGSPWDISHVQCIEKNQLFEAADMIQLLERELLLRAVHHQPKALPSKVQNALAKLSLASLVGVVVKYVKGHVSTLLQQSLNNLRVKSAQETPDIS